MAEVKISELANGTNFADADEIPYIQGGVTKRGTVAELATQIVPAASATVAGKVELATDAEAITGTDTARATTPANVKAVMDAHVDAADPHTGYQKESEKGAANGYAPLGADSLVPNANLPATVDLASLSHFTPLTSSTRFLAWNTAGDTFGYCTGAEIQAAYGGADTSAPTLTSATIPSAGTSISLLFDESVSIGAGGNGGFTIAMSGGAVTMTYASGSGSNTLVYNLSRTIQSGETCSDFDYTQPGNGVEDGAGNDLATFTNQQAKVTNSSTQNSAPTLTSATIPSAGTSISLLFSETVSIGAGGNGGFTIAMSGGAVTMTYASGSGSNTLVYNLSRTVNSGETCSDFDYTQPGNGVEDGAGNDLASFSNQQASVTNNSTQGGGDPQWANVRLLVANENGANGTNTFTDQSTTGHTIVLDGSPVWDSGVQIQSRNTIKTSNSPQGAIYVSAVSTLALGSGDFCIEGFTQYATTPGVLFETDETGSNVLSVYPSGGNYIFDGFGATRSASIPAAGTPFHWAVSRVGGTVRWYLDGAKVGTDISNSTNFTANRRFFLGASRNLSGHANPSAHFGGARVTIGHGRGYTGATITVPTLPFANS